MCASVVAATGGIKNCCSRESSHPAADEKSVLGAPEEKYIFYRAWRGDMKRAKDEVEGMKAALWDSSVKLTRADDRTSPQSQTVSCKLLVNYGACPVHHTVSVCNKHACAHRTLCVCVD